MTNKYFTNISFRNPFTNEISHASIDCSEQADKARIEAIKTYIKDHLSNAISSIRKELRKVSNTATIGENLIRKTELQHQERALEYLTSQLYQPTNLDLLIIKILKFHDELSSNERYQEVIYFLKNVGQIVPNQSTIDISSASHVS